MTTVNQLEPASSQETARSGCSVSVIVPVFNVERYIDQCMSSLLDQSFPFDSIILVDDGSTDASGTICDRYAMEYPIVRCVHKRNEGLGFARNTGLDVLGSDSDYVMFVDSDDWLEPNALEQLVEAAVGCDADCVIGGHTKKDSGNNTRFLFKLENATYEGSSICTDLIPRLCGSAPGLSDSIPMSVWSSLFRVSSIQEHALRFPSEREVISEDFVFKFNFLLRASRVVTSDFTQYCYRTNNSSLSRSYRPDRFEASLSFYNKAVWMVCEAGLSDECITRLQKTLFIYLRTCIKQESKAISGKAFREARRFIAGALKDKTVRDIINEYPSAQLHWQQRLFFTLLRFRAAGVLLLLANAGAL